MGKKIHILVDGICTHCNVPAKQYASGPRCPTSKSKWSGNGYKYKLLKERNKCERCGFVPEHLSQLDLDHIDNNHHNNKLNNFQVLCANCHRLKTHYAHIGKAFVIY